MKQPRALTLQPVRANAGTQAWYRAQLDAAVLKMHESVKFWVLRAYRGNPPEVADLADDESPAVALRKAVSRLRGRWEKEFDRLARRVGPEFAMRAGRHADAAWAARMRSAGFTVRFRTTRAVNDVLQAAVAENVQLIKSVAEQYLGSVEGLVMRSVQQGHGMAELSQQLQLRYGVTARRAATIARDQNHKAVAAVTRVRQLEAGIDKARWVHSTAGKVPRRSHVRMNGELYDVAKGMWDPDEGRFVHPGELINCRCVSRPVLEGFA